MWIIISLTVFHDANYIITSVLLSIMGYLERSHYYEKIELIRGRPLIVYMTSRRQFNGGALSLDVMSEFCEHIRNIPEDVKEVDLLISSQGGDPVAAWRIVSLLRERFDKISVLIPYDAQSAATVLALGANEIIMHPFSYSGPIDAQIDILPRSPNELPKSVSTKDIESYIDFMKNDLMISDEELGKIASESLLSELDPSNIGAIKKSMVFIESLATKLLEFHIEDENSIKEIVDKFTGFSHHGYTIGKTEAIKLNLPVVKDVDKELEELIWKVWDDADHEMKCREPFDLFSVIIKDKEVMDRLSMKSEPKKNAPRRIETVEDDTVIAILETKGMKSHYDVKAIVSAFRENDLNITTNVRFTGTGWITERV